MDATRLGLLALAATMAGAINSVAGGGSLISWPAAVAAGIPPVAASATNTVALTPGVLASAWAYRRELKGNGKLALLLTLPGAVGGIIGATLLLAVPARVFEIIVPWLVFGATLILILKDVLWRKAAASAERGDRKRSAIVGFGLFAIAVYGGYFGAGLGIVTLALLALLHRMNIHQMNAMKTVITGGINGVAAVYFLLRGAAYLPAAGVMLVGSVAGGFAGASLARRVNPRVVRLLVVGIGVVLSVLLAIRYWGHGS